MKTQKEDAINKTRRNKIETALEAIFEPDEEGFFSLHRAFIELDGFFEGDRVCVDHLYVPPKYRRQGMARRALQTLKRLGSNSDLRELTVRIGNPEGGGKKMLEALGFNEIEVEGVEDEKTVQGVLTFT